MAENCQLVGEQVSCPEISPQQQPESFGRQKAQIEMIVISSSSDEATESDSDRDGSRSRAARIVREEAGPSRKKAKGVSGQKLFQRIWSLEDEIVILKGLAEYFREKGSDPMADLSDFLSFIKGDLNLDCTRKQLNHKIGSLKKKYKKYKTREVESGVQQIFSNRHKQKAYELSGVVWGDSVLCKREEGTGFVRRAEVVRGESSSSGVEEMVERAWVEMCTFEGDGEWKKKLRAEDVRRHCQDLEEKLLHSRFVYYVLSCKKDSSST